MPPALRSRKNEESTRGFVEDYCTLHTDDVALNAELTSVPEPRGLVIFAMGSGSGRHSPRNRYVADFLRSHAGVSTLLVDLLASGETGIAAQRLAFDIDLLARRLIAATAWAAARTASFDIPIGYFGASTGAAAALVASTQCSEVTAVVSRGGRPDLAGHSLDRVTAPTLLLAGNENSLVMERNRIAHSRMSGTRELLVVPGASNLFEEPRQLDEVAVNASAWFARHLRGVPEHSEVRTYRRL
jgi:putative phosphoribosyl transferase